MGWSKLLKNPVSGDLSIAKDADNTVADVLRISNTNNPADGETGQKARMTFGLMGTNNDGSSYVDVNAGRITVGKDSDFFGATWNPSDSYMSFETMLNGTETEVLRLNSDKTAILTGDVHLGASSGDNEGRASVKMDMSGVDWTDGNWSEVWDSASTPGSKFNDCVFHIDTLRGGGSTGGIVGIGFSPGWQGHQNWGIYSFNILELMVLP